MQILHAFVDIMQSDDSDEIENAQHDPSLRCAPRSEDILSHYPAHFI